MLRVSLAVCAVIGLVMRPPAAAQAMEAKGNCYVQMTAGALQGPTQLNLGACAFLAGQQSTEMKDGIGRAKWDGLEIQAKSDGTYQAFQDGIATATHFWNVEQLVNDRVADIDSFWQRTFDSKGWDYEAPKRVQAYASRIRTACGRAPSYNAMYCRPAHSIYYDVRLLQFQFGSIGDHAPTTVIAHEWGHAIQSQRGILRKVKSTYALEQQADCFAGAYTQDAASRGVLDEGDTQESIDLLGKLRGSKSHGNSKQRTAAFKNGLQNGVEVCWKYAG